MATGQSEKTNWDKISVIIQAIGALAIPISIAVLIFQIWQFNSQQQFNSQAAQQQRYQTILDTYLDRMSNLLLMSNLAASKIEDPVRSIAEAQTLTAVRNLDGPSKGTLVRFLWEAKLINGPFPIIKLFGANLTYADLGFDGSSGISQAGSAATSICHGQTILSRIINLNMINLQGAILSFANLSETDLNGADLSGANLSGANFEGANLCQATVGNQQLAQTSSLKGAIMPDGSMHP